jgi:hypothetical protein
MTVVLAMNEKDTLPPDVAVTDLHAVLLVAKPDLGVLQEWPKDRDAASKKMCAELGYGYARPRRGGGPAIWRLDTYTLRSVRSARLVGSELVGHLPGRRDRLGPSIATVVTFDGPALGNITKHCIIGYHLTAEVQMGDHYRTDLAHRLRVLRHKREKWHLGRLGRRCANKAITYLGGDSNYAGMQVRGFYNCWFRAAGLGAYPGGDLGGRAVTIVFHTRHPQRAPQTIKDHSDHFAVAVTYR